MELIHLKRFSNTTGGANYAQAHEARGEYLDFSAHLQVPDDY